MDVIHEGMDLQPGEQFLKENGLDERPVIALLPGSRKMEVIQMLKIMLQVVPLFPGYQFVIATAPSIGDEFYRSLTGNANVKLVKGQTYDVLKNSAAAAVTSGTATLETALLNIPQVVCYRGNFISYLIARQIVKVPFISLVNLIAGEKLVNELIQENFNAKNLKEEIQKLLLAGRRSRITEGYVRVRQLLGGQGASRRTAAAMIQYLKKKSVNIS